ncbi:mechanosensitive ion channel domain-containing protein [Methanocaldococcus infernus]
MNIRIVVKILILIALLSYLLSNINLEYTLFLFIKEYARIIFISAILVISGLIINDIVISFLERYAKKMEDKANEYIRLGYIFKYLVYSIIFLIILFLIQQNTSSLVVSLGLIGAAIAYALRVPILNMAGWLVILFSKNIKIGDRVKISNYGIGDIVGISTQHIYLSERDTNLEPTGRLLIVPNSIVFTESISNYTKRSPYVWDYLVVHFTLDSDVDKAKEIVLSSAEEVVGELMRKLYEKWKLNKYFKTKLFEKPFVRVGITRTSFYVKVFYITNVYEKPRVRSDIQYLILKKVKGEKDVKIAYPHVKAVVEWNKTS